MMKKSKMLLFILGIIGSILFSASTVSADESQPLNLWDIENETKAMTENNIRVKRADIIGWRFRNYNGKVQKRKFNYSKNKWIGQWEYV